MCIMCDYNKTCENDKIIQTELTADMDMFDRMNSAGKLTDDMPTRVIEKFTKLVHNRVQRGSQLNIIKTLKTDNDLLKSVTTCPLGVLALMSTLQDSLASSAGRAPDGISPLSS